MSDGTLQRIAVFLSSTNTDLAAHRPAVLDVLQKLKVAVTGMELFGARPEAPLETCLKEVAKCDVFVIVVGMRYGSIDEKTGRSFVQREYEEAFQREQDTLVYLIDEDRALIPPSAVDKGERAEQLLEFKELLKQRHTCETFRAAEDLADKVEHDLKRLFIDKKLTLDERRLRPSSEPDETMDLLRRFDVMPEQYAGGQLELSFTFKGRRGPVSHEECNALQLTFGASVWRMISLTGLPEAENLSDHAPFLTRLYADRQRAVQVFESDTKSLLKGLFKLQFGTIQRLVSLDPGTVVSLFGPEYSKVRDLATGEDFGRYLQHDSVKALVLLRLVE